MRIVSLNCSNCGAALQINDQLDYLACAHCGCQMHVERGGGTISLELVEAVSAIRTGSVQTAAEMALVRLEKERLESSRKIEALVGEVQKMESLFVEKDIYEERDLLATNQEAELLRAQIDTSKPLAHVAMVVACIVVLVGCFLLWNSAHGFFQKLGALALIVFGGGTGAIAIGVGLPYHLVVGWYKNKLQPVEARLRRHQDMVKLRDSLREGHAQLSSARVESERIDKDIRRNRTIVSPGH